MATAADWVAETKRHLLSGHVEERNRLSADITSGATTLTLEFQVSGVARGTLLEIDLEVMYVWEVSGTTLTVERAQEGSVAAAHLDGATVRVKPRFYSFAILKALNDELSDLSSPVNGLYRVLTADFDYDSQYAGYDLSDVTGAATLLDVLEVRAKTAGTDRYWPVLSDFTVARGVDATVFPSGVALFLHEGGYAGEPLSIRYKASFGSLAALSDDVSTTGLPATAYDIPPLGAAARLVMGRDVKRAFTESQPEPRRAEEVPPGSSLQAARGLLALRQQRIAAEASRLSIQNPRRLHAVASRRVI